MKSHIHHASMGLQMFNASLWLLPALLTISATSAIAATTPDGAEDKSADVDNIFAMIEEDCPGCAVAASLNGELVINRAYGLADLERNVPITAETLFDAGSIRKQFIAAAILLLVEDGKLALDEDVRKHIPELPDYGHKITIDHLLTHTSGIRDWQPLLKLAGGDPGAMTMILRQRGLNFEPGEEWSYSNSGYVLLPEIVERVSEVSFAEFARDRIFEPAGMKSTTWVDDPLTVVRNRALAYSNETGAWKMDMYLGNDRGGAGALFTTAVDLVAWNNALADKKLGKFVTEKLEEPATLNNGRKLTYTRGLRVEPFRKGGTLVWHSGGAAGYSAIAAHLPEQRISVAIMCNRDGGARPAFSGRIIDLFLPGSHSEVPPKSESVELEPEVLRSRTGLFFNEKTGEPLRLVAQHKTLTVSGRAPLVALSSDRFRIEEPTLFLMSEADFELHFVSADRVELKTKDGETARYRRAQPYEPSADDLKAFAGRYESDELMAVIEFSPGMRSLKGCVNNRPGGVLEFRPVDRDTFQFGGMIVRFTRDEDGKVAGFDFSNPVLRKVRFARTLPGRDARPTSMRGSGRDVRATSSQRL